MRRSLLIALATVLSFLLPSGAYAMTALSGSSGNTSAALNSNTNSSSYGNANEANFLRVKNSNSPKPGFTSGKIDVNSNALFIQAYVSNSSSSDMAHNTSLEITLPTGFSTSQTASAVLKSDNAGTLNDSVTMVDSQPFGLEFDQGAQVYIAKRSGTTANNYVNIATSNYRINGNVMTIDMGDLVGGYNQQNLLTVRVLVTRGNVLPAFACTGLSKSSIDNNRSTFIASSNGQAAGANVSGYLFTVKDSTGKVVNSSTVQNGVYSFNQTNAGTYTISVMANSDKGNVECTQQQITVGTTLSATTTNNHTKTSTTLPNTGAGDVFGLFSAASAIGGTGHYLFRRSRR